MAMKTALNKAETNTLINNFFKQFQVCLNQPGTNISHSLEKLLSSDFQLTTNGHHVCKNFSDYLHKLEKLHKKISHLSIQGPIEDPILGDNQIALQYEVHFTPHSGAKKIMFVMAQATIEDHKIARWSQVSHEKGMAHST